MYAKYITQNGYSEGSGQKKDQLKAPREARSNTRSQSPALRMSDSPGTKAGQFEIDVDSMAMKVGQSANGQKQQQPQTVRPQCSKIGTRKQNTSKMSDRLSRVDLTFGQLLAKYMKKVIPHNRPIKNKAKNVICVKEKAD